MNEELIAVLKKIAAELEHLNDRLDSLAGIEDRLAGIDHTTERGLDRILNTLDRLADEVANK